MAYYSFLDEYLADGEPTGKSLMMINMINNDEYEQASIFLNEYIKKVDVDGLDGGPLLYKLMGVIEHSKDYKKIDKIEDYDVASQLVDAIIPLSPREGVWGRIISLTP